MPYHISPSAGARIVAALVSVVLLAGALFFGLVVLLVAVGLMAVIGLYAWVRARWFGVARRSVGQPSGPAARGGEEIDGEYTIISRRRD